MSDENQIIIIKKKSGHAGHHGGAWKVAYADFVTAMMSLFIVLWLMSSSKPVQEAVGGYFRDPYGVAQKKGTAAAGAGEASAPKKEDLSKLKEDLVHSLQKMANFDALKKQIEITVTAEGLRVELLEDSKGTFFENGKAQPTPALEEILKVLSVEAGKLPNPISIEGHTDSKPYATGGTYSNWELSADRANMARRLMEDSGLRPHQVVQVRGFADTNLRKPDQPNDASNRRVTIIIQYRPKADLPPGIIFGGEPQNLMPPAPAAAPITAATREDAENRPPGPQTVAGKSSAKR